MTKKKKKLSGKEHAKLNKRKKFYSKLERLVSQFEDDGEFDPVIFLSRNKSFLFPNFDDLSLEFKDTGVSGSENYNLEDFDSIDFHYLEEARFLTIMATDGLVKIISQETTTDEEGNALKGSSGENENYNYQEAYNWVIFVLKPQELITVLQKEMDEPTIYDMDPGIAKIQEPVYRKSYKPPRRRRR